LALAGVSLDVTLGEVHPKVGENGAGKTTLMQVLAGLVPADAGRIWVRDREVVIDGAETAYRLGIAMVHQHFALFPSMTVAENVTIGREPRRRGFYDQAAAVSAVSQLAERYGLRVEPTARVAALSVGDLQRLEILRALFRGAEILVLDEPTAVLTPRETEGLFRVIRDLIADGKTVVFISHKLEEVRSISDTITVLRDGRVTGTVRAAEASEQEIARLMVGRELFLDLAKVPGSPGSPVLELQNLSGPGVQRVSFMVRAGEIVGIAGVAGNGQTELAELIAGLLPAHGGKLCIAGADVTARSVAERRRAGLAYIPDDRYGRGLAAEASVSDNLLMGSQERPSLSRRGVLDRRAILNRARELLDRFAIRADDPSRPARTLSGGNAQRVVVARELADDVPLIVASQPTRGVDIAATEFIRGELLRRRQAGSAILLISAELSEVMALADRILVMYRGKIVAELRDSEADELSLGLLMAGIAPQAPAHV
jgi:ABC-type uncharacterized transport system ATPase subunit